LTRNNSFNSIGEVNRLKVFEDDDNDYDTVKSDESVEEKEPSNKDNKSCCKCNASEAAKDPKNINDRIQLRKKQNNANNEQRKANTVGLNLNSKSEQSSSGKATADYIGKSDCIKLKYLVKAAQYMQLSINDSVTINKIMNEIIETAYKYHFKSEKQSQLNATIRKNVCLIEKPLQNLSPPIIKKDCVESKCFREENNNLSDYNSKDFLKRDDSLLVRDKITTLIDKANKQENKKSDNSILNALNLICDLSNIKCFSCTRSDTNSTLKEL
jgi:hypothetical protein